MYKLSEDEIADSPYYKYENYMRSLLGHYALLNPRDVTQEDERGAEQAIKEMYAFLKRIKPEEKYRTIQGMHMLYLLKIFELDTALKERKYCAACNALFDCVEYGILQGRCYYNVLEILEERMELLNNEK